MSKAQELLKEVEDRRKAVRQATKEVERLKLDEDKLELSYSKLDLEKEEKKVKSELVNIMESFPYSILCTIKEKQVDEKKGTVIAGILEEDTLSANDRFYPAHVVHEAIKSLPGKRSLIGHDTSSVEDVIAKITASRMKGKIGIAEFKFASDEKSQAIFNKVKDGMIDSVSIRASGMSRRGKVNGKMVDVVESLDIQSVDWVLEGGVKAAKVVSVLEEKPTISFNEDKQDDKQEDEMEVKELTEKLDAQNKLMEDLKKQNEANDVKIKESEEKTLKAELDSYKEKKLSEITDENIRGLVREQLNGKSEEDIDKKFDQQIKFIKSVHEKSDIKDTVILKPTDGEQKKGYKNVNDMLESKEFNEGEKVKILSSLMI